MNKRIKKKIWGQAQAQAIRKKLSQGNIVAVSKVELRNFKNYYEEAPLRYSVIVSSPGKFFLVKGRIPFRKRSVYNVAYTFVR